jgi:hypothetical protein
LSIPLIKELFPRLFLTVDQDGSVIHRMQANVYGAIGTFYLSPLIGVSYEEALHAMEVGYKKIGLFIGNYFIDKVTYHNQLFFFFRQYGFIGVFFYVALMFSFILKAFSLKEDFKQKIILSIILFYFFYTLSHNNKWTMDYYIWLFLSYK